MHSINAKGGNGQGARGQGPGAMGHGPWARGHGQNGKGKMGSPSTRPSVSPMNERTLHASRRARHERAKVTRESNGGGAGICTRVRKYIPAGIYDAYPLLKSRSRREEAA